MENIDGEITDEGLLPKLQTDLAAAQARIAEMRGVLENVQVYLEALGYSADRDPLLEAIEGSLLRPDDMSALREFGKRVIDVWVNSSGLDEEGVLDEVIGK